MATFHKAKTLKEVAAQVIVEPLPYGDPRYVDISGGRGESELRRLKMHLEDFEASQNRFAKVAFTGNRGCGKSTELARLERDLSSRFTAVHLVVDESLFNDCDYTDLMLWLVEGIASKFGNASMPLNSKFMHDVADWFAETTLEDISAVKKEIKASAEAEVQAKTGGYWLAVKLLLRIESTIAGSIEHRKSIRSKLQNRASELIDRVNLFLDEAQRVLHKNEKPSNLLIVQDNLDRLYADAGRRLFLENGDALKRLNAHLIYTVPTAITLAPQSIGTVFEHLFTMPMVKVRHRDGRLHREGIESLLTVLDARLELNDVFGKSRKVPRYIAEMSGGSVRDLLRLVGYAQLAARADDKSRIDHASAEQAVKKLRNDFTRLLVPGQVYFPILAQINQTKQDCMAADMTAEASRGFFRDLLLNGSVLEYNGDGCWYDVHPVVQQIEAFQDARRKLPTSGS